MTTTLGKHVKYQRKLWKGVRSTLEPGDDTPNTLQGLQNGYIPDCVNGSAIYSRPGFVATNSLSASMGTGQCQRVYVHTATDGTNYNFLFANGKVFRQPTDLTSAPTDVTPTGINIATGTSTTPANVTSGRIIYCTSLNDQLIVNDGVNKPWVGTNLSSTPITGTTIDYQTASNVLSIGSTVTKVASATFKYMLFASGSVIQYTHTADVVGAVIAAGTIPADKWGSYKVSVNSSDTVTVTGAAANGTTGYASEAAAIAALPATPAGGWFAGYFTVLTGAGVAWVAGTNALAGGGGANPATTTNYYAGESPPWVAFGQPVIYAGAVFFVLRYALGTNSPSTFAWSEPNQPTVGYQQTNYANFWTYTQTGTTPIYCLAPTNTALYISRDLSWGAVFGAPGVNFSSTATHALIAVNVGCNAPATVLVFGNYVWFNDVSGRTHRFAVGTTSGVEPLWLAARKDYEIAAAAGQTTASAISAYTWSVIEPNLNLYITAAYPTTTTNFAPQLLYVYDVVTGAHMGIWFEGADTHTEGYSIGGLLRDANNQCALIILGTLSGTNGEIWKLARVDANVWKDNGVDLAMLVAQRFGTAMSTELVVTNVKAMTGSATAVGLSTVTSTGTVAEGTPTPPSSGDVTYLAQWKPQNTRGRGVVLALAPFTTATQWKLFELEVEGTLAIITVDSP